MSDRLKPRLAIPSYDHALDNFVASVLEGLRGVDPLLGEIQIRQTGHVGPVRNVTSPQPVDHPLKSIQDEFSIHLDVIRNTDVEQFVEIIVRAVRNHLDSISGMMTDTIREVAEAVENSVDAGGRPLSWDLLIDAIERTDLSFDREGKISGERIIVNPKTAEFLASIERTPEQEQRLNAILRRKKEAWDAQQRSRRLPRPSQGTGV